MFQAKVYSVSTRRVVSSRGYDTRELAAGSLAVLLRINGHTSSRETLTAELAGGARVIHGRFVYWVQERP